MEYYFIGKDGQQYGPFPAQDLLNYGINPQTPVWAEGMADWTAAGNVPEINQLFAAAQAAKPEQPQGKPSQTRNVYNQVDTGLNKAYGFFASKEPKPVTQLLKYIDSGNIFVKPYTWAIIVWHCLLSLVLFIGGFANLIYLASDEYTYMSAFIGFSKAPAVIFGVLMLAICIAASIYTLFYGFNRAQRCLNQSSSDDVMHVIPLFAYGTQIIYDWLATMIMIAGPAVIFSLWLALLISGEMYFFHRLLLLIGGVLGTIVGGYFIMVLGRYFVEFLNGFAALVNNSKKIVKNTEK